MEGAHQRGREGGEVRARPAKTATFLQKTTDLLTFLMPNYARGQGGRITVAIGCTGGKHPRRRAGAQAVELFQPDKALAVHTFDRDVDEGSYRIRRGVLHAVFGRRGAAPAWRARARCRRGVATAATETEAAVDVQLVAVHFVVPAQVRLAGGGRTPQVRPAT
ncbi:MAG: hypothetical protein IPJ65_03525 [Archangiaceae bacterium]|nr:hypothetical protein [Archangiaceae bacterium]